MMSGHLPDSGLVSDVFLADSEAGERLVVIPRTSGSLS